jgi:serine phosphatase RsbU (regulator of sigma subunit)
MSFTILLLLTVLITVYFNFSRPIAELLRQMKNLLTNRSYKKILVNRKDEIGIIAHFFNEVTTAFEKVSAEIKEGKRVSGELEMAGQLQHELLPTKAPKVKGLDIIVKNRSAEELGGDNFDIITKDNNTYFYLGDVTGHGVPAAIIMTMVNTLINTFVEIYQTAYDVVVQTNRRLKTRIRSTFFMSMIMLRWDSAASKMSYVGCGHEYLVIYRANKGVCESTVTGGIALGMIADNSKIVKEIDIQMEKGDLIMLYTDGLTEAKNMEGEQYGLERFKKAIETFAPQYEPEGVVYHVAKDFSKFVEEHVQEDDVTVIAIKYVGDGIQGQVGGSLIDSTSWLPEGHIGITNENKQNAESENTEGKGDIMN